MTNKNAPVSLMGASARKFAANRPAVVSLLFLIAVLALCLLAPWLTAHDPVKINLRSLNQEPSAEHWLGTDKGGRDMVSRLLFGGRATLWISLCVTAIIAGTGTVVGVLAGYFGGSADSLLMRMTDVVLSFPFIILVIVVKSVDPDGGIPSLIWTVGLLGWGGFARVIRAKTLAEKENEYMLAARALGAGTLRILTRHLLPGLLGVFIVNLMWTAAAMIGVEASLSFLGFGVPVGQPSWGNMLADALSPEVISGQWWVWLPACLLITGVILSIHFIGEGVKEAISIQERHI
ncbi:peptide/nickel transport system permease protein [Paenibacillus forsythiae]|uniref:Peptide/nickel transport system permease protein n=1 Tax=Paenibacillus forsythiae TaxID=365616 RepID=A0ABU3H363_9BACL|nr:ABC transporter permease [Paenibacillus forsythiae]MDT3425247.1 peptide/nickel transport system permease protein [Paenibacillus forsythiae]